MIGRQQGVIVSIWEYMDGIDSDSFSIPVGSSTDSPGSIDLGMCTCKAFVFGGVQGSLICGLEGSMHVNVIRSLLLRSHGVLDWLVIGVSRKHAVCY